MTLIKTSVLTAISTVIKVISAFIINKLIAVYIGPSGLAMIGQLQNFLNAIMIFSNGGITQGIIKYTAEYKTMKEKSKIFSNSIVISFIFSLIISILLFSFNDYFALLILKDIQFSNVFSTLGFSVFLFALNTILLSILNGQKEIHKYILVSISGSVLSLVFTSFLVYKYQLSGALYAMVLNQSIIFFLTLFLVIKSKWFKLEYFIKGLDKETLVKLGKFSLMALSSALTIPISELIIRNYISETLGWDDAGYWQGIMYISNMYLLVITTSLGIYYLPKLSEITDKLELKKEILNGYKIIMPIVMIMAFSIYLFRDLVIYIAFNDKFVAMRELFLWQLVGDVIKISSWLLAYLMLAKAMTKVFIISEIIFVTSWTILAILGVKYFGLIGVTYAFSLNYLFYFIFIYFYFKKVVFS
jgi:PST family polysaccharide transporter